MNIRFGRIIKLLRSNKKMTQIEFAKQLGVSRELVSKWEQGKCIPGHEAIESIGDYFGIDPKCLAVADELIFDGLSSCIPCGMNPAEVAIHVLSFIDFMTADECALFDMCYVEHLSSKQIAEQMHLSDGTIRNKLVNLRKKLKEFIAATRTKK